MINQNPVIIQLSELLPNTRIYQPCPLSPTIQFLQPIKIKKREEIHTHT